MNYSGEEIGKIIKREREKKNFTQAKLANKVHVTPKQISVYEKGSTIPPIEMLFKFCEIFECELGYLLGEKQYSEKTKVNTVLSEDLGLTAEAIERLTHITALSKKTKTEFDSIVNKVQEKEIIVLNKLLSSSFFHKLIYSLAKLEEITSDTQTKEQKMWDALKLKLGNEHFNKAEKDSKYLMQVDYYDSSVEDINKSIKYINEHFESKQPKDSENNLSEEEIHSAYEYLTVLDKCIDLQQEIEFPIKVYKYDINKTLIELIDDLYP